MTLSDTRTFLEMDGTYVIRFVPVDAGVILLATVGRMDSE